MFLGHWLIHGWHLEVFLSKCEVDYLLLVLQSARECYELCGQYNYVCYVYLYYT